MQSVPVTAGNFGGRPSVDQQDAAGHHGKPSGASQEATTDIRSTIGVPPAAKVLSLPGILPADEVAKGVVVTATDEANNGIAAVDHRCICEGQVGAVRDEAGLTVGPFLEGTTSTVLEAMAGCEDLITLLTSGEDLVTLLTTGEDLVTLLTTGVQSREMIISKRFQNDNCYIICFMVILYEGTLLMSHVNGHVCYPNDPAWPVIQCLSLGLRISRRLKAWVSEPPLEFPAASTW
jgi:hypothetical protein